MKNKEEQKENLQNKEKVKLNLGCGEDIRKDWINLDCINFDGVDVVCDLKKLPWPFKDNTFDEIYSRGTLMLLPDLINSMKELGRICKNGAKISMIEACFPCISTFQDPLVKTVFTYYTMDYFNGDYHGYTAPGIKFRIIKKEYMFSASKKLSSISKLINHFPNVYSRFLINIFPSRFIYYELEVVKD
jgi:ubiquinone/menaquinone biosynthesis C-methylase UbiE